MPRQIYKGRVIAIAGELPGQFTSSNLKAWITARKGKFTTSLDENVTHLLCTHEQYKKRVPRSESIVSDAFNLLNGRRAALIRRTISDPFSSHSGPEARWRHCDSPL